MNLIGGMNLSMLGDRLREERERRGWSQVYVAEKLLNMKRSSTYANWEYGLREPDAEMLSNLADLYECTTDYLLGRTDERNDTKNFNDVINAIELSDEEFLIRIPIYFKGMELTYDEKKEFFAISQGILSAKKALKEKN